MKKNNKGFSLVELIVVIAIMAILAAVAVIGVSVYIPKAQQANDKQLAADVMYAMNLAMQTNELTAGDYVVIYLDKDAMSGNNNYDDVNTIESAMVAVFGADWKQELRLTWDGWKSDVGVIGDQATMDIVKDSNFSPESMDSLLSQVQLVVDEAGGYLSRGNIPVSGEIAEIMNKNGIEINAGEYLNSTTGTAAANAYVYLVAGELGSLNIVDPEENEEAKAFAFLECWVGAEDSAKFAGNSNWDVASNAAAEYARVYALATYIDTTTRTTNYAEQMNEAGDPRTVGNTVLNAIQTSSDPNVQAALTSYYDETNGNSEAYKDAVSFLAYMQGVSNSADSLMGSTNLNNSTYFTDGYIASYVNNYISLCDIMAEAGAQGNAFTFIYTGEEIVCMPLDY